MNDIDEDETLGYSDTEEPNLQGDENPSTSGTPMDDIDENLELN